MKRKSHTVGLMFFSVSANFWLNGCVKTGAKPFASVAVPSFTLFSPVAIKRPFQPTWQKNAEEIVYAAANLGGISFLFRYLGMETNSKSGSPSTCPAEPRELTKTAQEKSTGEACLARIANERLTEIQKIVDRALWIQEAALQQSKEIPGFDVERFELRKNGNTYQSTVAGMAGDGYGTALHSEQHLAHTIDEKGYHGHMYGVSPQGQEFFAFSLSYRVEGTQVAFTFKSLSTLQNTSIVPPPLIVGGDISFTSNFKIKDLSLAEGEFEAQEQVGTLQLGWQKEQGLPQAQRLSIKNLSKNSEIAVGELGTIAAFDNPNGGEGHVLFFQRMKRSSPSNRFIPDGD